jgi:uncharacterized protein
MDGLSTPPPEGGKLLANLMHFARALREAGLPVGPGKVLAAAEAVRAVGIQSRADFYWALHSVLVNRRDQRAIFDQAFHIFWRNPKLLEKILGLTLSGPRRPGDDSRAMNHRLAEALRASVGQDARTQEEKIKEDAAIRFSPREVLQETDFEKMSNDELAEARDAVRRLGLALAEQPTRRFMADPRGTRIDLRATLRAQLRSTGIIALKHKRRADRPPPLVVLCDISGSMGRYTHIFLHFLHAAASDRERVHAFLFGTRLSNITRPLKTRDPDEALDKVAAAVEDWSGGTRIGACLAEFNRRWSRRVLGQGAVVLLITDGLDREGGTGIARAMERLHKSCRRLIWLNPLLRYAGFAPKSLGMKAILPYVDEFRPVHNLKSLAALARELKRLDARRLGAARDWPGTQRAV